MSERFALLWSLAGPPLVWALHFIAVYAGISAACASRGLMTTTEVALIVFLATLIGVVIAGFGAIRPPRGVAEPFRRTARYLSAISAAAIVFNALPFLFSTACGGG